MWGFFNMLLLQVNKWFDVAWACSWSNVFETSNLSDQETVLTFDQESTPMVPFIVLYVAKHVVQQSCFHWSAKGYHRLFAFCSPRSSIPALFWWNFKEECRRQNRVCVACINRKIHPPPHYRWDARTLPYSLTLSHRRWSSLPHHTCRFLVSLLCERSAKVGASQGALVVARAGWASLSLWRFAVLKLNRTLVPVLSLMTTAFTPAAFLDDLSVGVPSRSQSIFAGDRPIKRQVLYHAPLLLARLHLSPWFPLPSL